LVAENEVILRMTLAVILGGMIGLERERLHVGFKTYSAGFRTHILVCVGSALAMVVSENLHFQFKGDAARVAAQVISGIGFLGAGAILREGFLVRGLTTAASLWVVCSIGLAVGAGYYFAASLSCLLVLFALVILGTIEDFVRSKRTFDSINIVVGNRPEVSTIVKSVLDAHHLNIESIEIKKLDDRQILEISLNIPPQVNKMELINELASLPGVHRVEHRM